MVLGVIFRHSISEFMARLWASKRERGQKRIFTLQTTPNKPEAEAGAPEAGNGQGARHRSRARPRRKRGALFR